MRWPLGGVLQVALFTPPAGLSYFRLLRRTIAAAKRLPATCKLTMHFPTVPTS
jgi:hypothetical protein